MAKKKTNPDRPEPITDDYLVVSPDQAPPPDTPTIPEIETEPIPIVEQIYRGERRRYIAPVLQSQDTALYEPVWLSLFELKFLDRLAINRVFPMSPDIPMEDTLLFVEILYKDNRIEMMFNENTCKTHVFSVAQRLSNGEILRLGDATIELRDRAGRTFTTITLKGLVIEDVSLPYFDYREPGEMACLSLTVKYDKWEVTT